jgi:hypothetical protein
MMWRAVLIFVALLALVLAQSSFFNHFPLFLNKWFQILNLVVIFVAVFALFEKRSGRMSYLAAVWGGFLLDIYSEMFFGFWIALFLISVFAIKRVIKRYVSIPSFW